MDHQVSVSAIARFLDQPYVGADFLISGVSSFDNPREFTLSLLTEKNIRHELNLNLPMLWLVPENFIIPDQARTSFIKIKNPKLAFAQVLTEFFVKKEPGDIATTATIHPSVKLGKNVKIADYVCLEANVEIGDNTRIDQYSVISANTKIGASCYIKSGVMIGGDGFGFAFEEGQALLRIPHLGRVVIGANVEIGANSTIARGTIDDTVINDYVKIDDQVHIGHNCVIGRASIITACAELSGSVKVGEYVWIAPNVSIIQKVNIGDHAVIGIGAIVTEDVPANSTLMGLSSLKLKVLARLKAFIENLSSSSKG